MKKIVAGAMAISMLASPVLAKGSNIGHFVAGAVLGGIAISALKEEQRDHQYHGYYNVDNDDPCYYSPPQWLVRSDPEKASFEQGRMARLCEEKRAREQRAYECGYNGRC